MTIVSPTPEMTQLPLLPLRIALRTEDRFEDMLIMFQQGKGQTFVTVEGTRQSPPIGWPS